MRDTRVRVKVKVRGEEDIRYKGYLDISKIMAILKIKGYKGCILYRRTIKDVKEL